MKISMAKIYAPKAYFVLVSLLLGVLAVSLYAIAARPMLPECKAVLHSTNEVAGRKIERVLLISVVSSGWHEATFLLNGRILDGNEKMSVARSVVMSSERQGKYYHLQVKANHKSPGDNVKRSELDRLLPVQGQSYYVNIEQLDDNNFIFIDNHAPMFVCTLPYGK